MYERFSQANACWFASTRADGRAHLAPIWHVVLDRHIYVVTGSSSVRAANVAVHPQVSLSLPDPMDVAIMEGWARPAPARKAVLRPLFLAKYDWDIETDPDYSLILEIIPRKALTWGKDGEGRWRFPAEEG